MSPNSILMAVFWLAALGLAVLVSLRVVGRVGARAAANI